MFMVYGYRTELVNVNSDDIFDLNDLIDIGYLPE